MRRLLVVAVLLVGTGRRVGLDVDAMGGFSARANPSIPERVLARAARHLAVPSSGRNATNPIPFSPETWADARARILPITVRAVTATTVEDRQNSGRICIQKRPTCA